jgi:hypothetical protein
MGIKSDSSGEERPSGGHETGGSVGNALPQVAGMARSQGAELCSRHAVIGNFKLRVLRKNARPSEAHAEQKITVCTSHGGEGSLNHKQIGQIRSLESQLGKRLLSFTRQDIQVAELNQEELGTVRDLENKLGVALVAIK